MKSNKIKFSTILLFFITYLTSFGLGAYVIYSWGDSGENTQKGGQITQFVKESLLKKDLDLDIFWQVYTLISQNYYSSDEMVKKDQEYGMIRGLVDSLGDKYSEFMTPEITKEFEENLSGDFEGIGAVITKHDLGIEIDRVLKGSPALKYGVLKGDIVIEANGEPLKDLTTTEAVNFIKGPAGSQVTLKILRSGESDFLLKEITRDKIKIPSVDTLDMQDDEIGYIALNMFGENTSKEFREFLDTFKNDSIKGIIIDLRDNGGGYLNSAVEILSNFIENGKVLVTTKYKDDILDNSYNSFNNGDIFDKKIVVLINGNSASASEITAGALKDYNKAILVGEKTYGKGSVQQPFDLPDGSMLKLTIAKWYTPKDYSIDHNGIDPDIEVSFEKQDYEDAFDRQLDMAKKVLKEYINLENIALVKQKFEDGEENEDEK